MKFICVSCGLLTKGSGGIVLPDRSIVCKSCYLKECGSLKAKRS